MGLANALTAQPFLALIVGIGFYFVVWAGSSIGSLGLPSLEYLSYLFPTAFKYQLISDSWGDIGAALAHQAACTVVFFGAGLAFFRWRDL
jgi:hypothetical protein